MRKRTERERRIVDKMIQRFCQDNHRSSDLCESCFELKEYAFKRLVSCPFANDKPVCSNCSIHCYNKKKKEEIKNVMKYSGPKMIFNHPKDTFLYFFDKLKNKNHLVQ